MIRRPPRSTQSRSSAASDVYKRQGYKSKRIQEDFNMLVEKYRGIFDHSKSGIAVYKVVGDGDDFVFKDLNNCLLYASDAADDLLCVDLGGRRIIKKKKKKI